MNSGEDADKLHDPYKGESNAKSYLINDFGLKWKWYLLKRRTNLSTLEAAKFKIKANHSIDQLKIIKADLSSELEQAKSFTALISTITIIVTILVAITNLILNNSFRVADLISKIDEKIMLNKGNANDIYKEHLEFAYVITDHVSTFGNTLLIISILVLVSVFIIISSIRTLSRLIELISQAHDEKVAEEKRLEEIRIMEKREQFDRKKIRVIKKV